MSDLEQEEAFAKARLERRTFHRIGSLMRPVARRIGLLVGIEVLLAATVLARPWPLQAVIDHGLVSAGHHWHLVPSVLAWSVAGLVLLWIGRFGFGALGQYLTNLLAVDVLNDLRARVFAHVQSLSMRYFDRTKAGRIIARADRDVDTMEPLLVNMPPELLGILLRSIGSGVLLYRLDHLLFWTCLPLLPAVAVSAVLFEKLGNRVWGRVHEAKSRVTAHLCETITGVQVIQQQAFARANARHYAGLLGELDRRSVIGAWSSAWFGPFASILNGLGLALLIVVGGREFAAGTITAGQFAQAMFYLFIFLGPLQEIGDLAEKLATALAAGQRVFLLLDTPIEVRDAPGARALSVVAGGVTFERLRFAYEPGSPVIHGLDLVVPPGERLAIVGPTGHGKSTMVQLLSRFYEPQEGSIRIDGQDIQGVTQESLRQQVAVVLQDNILFSGSILDNLRIVRPELADAALIASVRELGADEILERLPAGYGTEVGPGGTFLSHGQRQLVCLVRAHLVDARILVLDEATSAVDPHTERRVQRALKRLTAGRTAIIVAHRLSTIRDADRIVVIEGGRLVESGDHAALIASGGRYADLYSTYVRAQH